MAYWRLFYHLVWATQNRMPLITSDLELTIYELLKVKAIGLGATVFAINGMPDHVHCAVSIPPSLSVAKFVGQIKGVASAKVNTRLATTGQRFAWQESYGVFSVDAKRLPYVIDYVQNQKQHHLDLRQDLIPILERTDDSGVQLVREESSVYLIGQDSWREEVLTLEVTSAGS